MRVSVVYALPEEQVWLPVTVEENAVVLSAIHQSNILSMFPTIELDKQKIGIFGKVSSLDASLKEGDRVEIYRPLIWRPDEIDDEDDE
jgi:putative ubiquitin-RnfH superfamily antitoxin RatB of RatAB toxin-antitoxin module